MKLSKLGDPSPQITPTRARTPLFAEGRIIHLPLASPPTISFVEVVEKRRSGDTIGEISQELLSQVLWYGAKTRAAQILEDGTVWEHRAAPSAGGLHPVEILLTRSEGPFFRYDPLNHSLRETEQFTNVAEDIRRRADMLLAWRKGILLVFVGCFGKTGARYVNPESLVWRDAGALLCSLAYAAAACEVNCVPLGTTFEPFVSQAFHPATLLWGTGGAVLGA